jgi:enoyl-CoA hydratase/carnithine racemase
MAENKWLTAQEALEWGFVDEIVEGGEPVRLTASVATAMASEGMPVPNMNIEADGFFEKLTAVFQKMFKANVTVDSAPDAEVEENPLEHSNNNQNPNNRMKKTFLMLAALMVAKEFTMPEASEDGKMAFDEAQLDAIEEALVQAQAEKDAKDSEIKALQEQLAQANERIEDLEALPAADNEQVVETNSKPADDEPSNDGGLAQVIANAREMMK